MIERANVAIIGGGIMGASAAFNIARDTKLKVVLLEKGHLAGGSTGGSAAVIRHYYSTSLMVRSAIESRKIFQTFKSSVGEPLSFVHNTYIVLDSGEPARTAAARVNEMRGFGLKAESLSPEDVRKRFPFLRVYDDEVGSFDAEAGFVPNPTRATEIYVRQAARHGATVYEATPVTRIRQRSGAVRSVATPKGEIEVDFVINCAGPWGSAIGAMVGLDYSIEPVRQQLIDLKPDKGWPLRRPTISDRRNLTYIKPASGGIAHAGGHYFGRPCDPEEFSRSTDREFEEDIMAKLVERVPELKGAKKAHSFSALYENTPDNMPLVGETEVKGFLMCAGWSGHGFKHGPFFGMLMKELVEKGKTSLDISLLDPSRFKKGERVTTPYNRLGRKSPVGPYG